MAAEDAHTNPKHEVAFSFLAPDLALATRFADSLAPLTTFVFSRKQEELAGTDDQESFRAAFRFDSRLNTILLRSGWGQTPWTRVEQTAIQERCLADGWDRLLVVRLDDSPGPKWIPQLNLYLDLRTFPFEQAVGAIKRQVQSLGGKPEAPSPLDAARSIARLAQFERETKDLFRTSDGIRQADDAVIRVADALHSDLQKVAPEYGWALAYGRNEAAYCVVRLQGCSVLLNWQRYFNSAEDCDLRTRVIPAPIETPDEQRAGKAFVRFGETSSVFQGTYKIHRAMDVGVCWRRGQEVLTPEQVAGELLQKMIQVVAESWWLGRESLPFLYRKGFCRIVSGQKHTPLRFLAQRLEHNQG